MFQESSIKSHDDDDDLINENTQPVSDTDDSFLPEDCSNGNTEKHDSKVLSDKEKAIKVILL